MGNWRIEIKWGVIFALMMLLWMVGEKAVGLHDAYIDKHPLYTNLVAIPAIVIYFLALLEKRRVAFNGVMDYWLGFKTGLRITLVVLLLTPVNTYITLEWITPDFFANAIAYATESGAMSRENVEEYFSFDSYLTQSIIGAPIMGTFTSGIVALFTKRR